MKPSTCAMGGNTSEVNVRWEAVAAPGGYSARYAIQAAVNDGSFRAATFFLVGAVSTVGQMIAVASLGLPVSLEWSTGGVVALVAGIWMWAACRSWAAWRKWVWLPVGITVVLAFVVVNLQVAAARTEAERVALVNIHGRVKAFAEMQRKSVVDMEMDIPGGKAGHTVSACRGECSYSCDLRTSL